MAMNTNRSLRPVYKDFRPLMEPKEDPQAKTVRIHLPGFVKEQIRIVAESGRRILRVRGERQISANKWIRFLEEVTVPENCDMAGITAKFEGGFLRISMPRKIAIAIAPQMVAPIPEIAPHQAPQTLGEAVQGEESKENEKYSKSMKGICLRRFEAERKSLMNVGVAGLVIVALAGWISYSVGSSARSSM